MPVLFVAWCLPNTACYLLLRLLLLFVYITAATLRQSFVNTPMKDDPSHLFWSNMVSHVVQHGFLNLCLSTYLVAPCKIGNATIRLGGTLP